VVRFNRRSVRYVAPELLRKLAFVVCVDLGIVTPAWHRHICQATIHEFFARLLCTRKMTRA